jgi:hypothetical protein
MPQAPCDVLGQGIANDWLYSPLTNILGIMNFFIDITSFFIDSFLAK